MLRYVELEGTSAICVATPVLAVYLQVLGILTVGDATVVRRELAPWVRKRPSMSRLARRHELMTNACYFGLRPVGRSKCSTLEDTYPILPLALFFDAVLALAPMSRNLTWPARPTLLPCSERSPFLTHQSVQDLRRVGHEVHPVGLPWESGSCTDQSGRRLRDYLCLLYRHGYVHGLYSCAEHGRARRGEMALLSDPPPRVVHTDIDMLIELGTSTGT